MDIIFRDLLTLPLRTDLSIEDLPNIRHFFQELCIHFTLGNVLQFHFSFLQSLLFYFLASLSAFSGPWKCRDCKFVGIASPYSSLGLKCFPVAKMSKAQYDRDENMDTIMEISVIHRQQLLLYSKNYYEPMKQHSCSLRWVGLSRVTKYSPIIGFQIII